MTTKLLNFCGKKEKRDNDSDYWIGILQCKIPIMCVPRVLF